MAFQHEGGYIQVISRVDGLIGYARRTRLLLLTSKVLEGGVAGVRQASQRVGRHRKGRHGVNDTGKYRIIIVVLLSLLWSSHLLGCRDTLCSFSSVSRAFPGL